MLEKWRFPRHSPSPPRHETPASAPSTPAAPAPRHLQPVSHRPPCNSQLWHFFPATQHEHPDRWVDDRHAVPVTRHAGDGEGVIARRAWVGGDVALTSVWYTLLNQGVSGTRLPSWLSRPLTHGSDERLWLKKLWREVWVTQGQSTPAVC